MIVFRTRLETKVLMRMIYMIFPQVRIDEGVESIPDKPL